MSLLKLKKSEERRIKAGHLWVFSNEVDVSQTPLTEFTPGQTVEIQSQRGDFLGFGYVNPRSLICGRICSTDPQRPFNTDLLLTSLRAAAALRETFYKLPYYRLVHGEGDFLPGLIIDRYADVFVLQLNTAGMENQKDALVEILVSEFKAKTILFRNDSSVRELEGLTRYNEVVYGELPETIELQENGLHFTTSLQAGQKTGWFYDHRENRLLLQRLVSDAKVLDVYSYLGGWGLNAAAAGASEVTCVDASKSALELATSNAKINGFSDIFHTHCGDAAAVLRDLAKQQQTYDAVILDPPAFIKRKKDYKAGLRQYALMNRLALALIKPGGYLVSASCSQHLTRNDLRSSMTQSASKLGRKLQIVFQGGQGPDHPVNAAMPESDYLKAFFAKVE